MSSKPTTDTSFPIEMPSDWRVRMKPIAMASLPSTTADGAREARHLVPLSRVVDAFFDVVAGEDDAALGIFTL